MLTFGLYVNYSKIYPDDEEDIYKETLRLAIVADAVGFSAIWTPEHHLIHFLQAPSALLTLAQISQHVKCRVGTAVSVLPYRHPLVWAGEFAQIDQITGGRFEIGIARGAYPYEFDRMGQDFKESNDRFRETLEILEKLWHSDEAVAHEGKHFKFGKAYPWPRPVQKPHPPIWVGGQSDATIEWAASNGYHVSHASFLNPIEHIQHVADVFHRAREAKGVARGKQQFGVLQQMYVSEDRRAVERMPEVVIRRNRIHHHLYRDFETSADNHAYVAPNPIDAPEPDRETVLKNLLMGSPEEVLEKVHALEAAGVDHLYVQAAFGLPMQQAIDSVRLFGEKVIQPYNASLRRAAS